MCGCLEKHPTLAITLQYFPLSNFSTFGVLVSLKSFYFILISSILIVFKSICNFLSFSFVKTCQCFINISSFSGV